MTTGALDRLVRRAASRRAESERCDLCSDPVREEHAHVLDERSETLLCACKPCSLLFEREGAGRGHYRLVPHRRLRLTGVRPGELGVPVSLAFFVRRPDGQVVAHYPSPAGATQWEVDPGAWERALSRCHELRALEPGVEALLVDTVQGADEQWIVPLDDCYRLVALVRRHWRGFTGGREVWGEIARFFAELGEQSRPGRGDPRRRERRNDG